jgi:hypothetical protein
MSQGELICAVCGLSHHRFVNRDDFEKRLRTMLARAPAAGPWIPVMEREPDVGTVVLARWLDGSVQVVSWSPKSFEGKVEGGHRVGDPPTTFSIYLANTSPVAIGRREWPTHWAELV